LENAAPRGGGGILARVIWGKKYEDVEKAGESVKEKGRKGKENEKRGKKMRKGEVNG
jgi:hypothetical protein